MRVIATILAVSLAVCLGLIYFVGTELAAPAPAVIADDALAIAHEEVHFHSDSGSEIHGWYVPASAPVGTIVLMHGVRANRLAMVSRVNFLHGAGYSVLLFDFQAHGESSGEHITNGYLESRDAQAAVAYARKRARGQFIGVIGVSQGGAAALLAHDPLPIGGLVLEAVYPDIATAIKNRLMLRFGSMGAWLSPLLLGQIEPRLGFRPSELSPVKAISRVTAPIMIIAGGADRHTTLADSKRLFDAASGPKSMWIIPDAAHVDFASFAGNEYQSRVLSFFNAVRAGGG